MGLNQIALFEGKVAGGNGEQVLSRDVYRLGQLFDFFRMLSFYFTTVGFYVCTMVWLLDLFYVHFLFVFSYLFMQVAGFPIALKSFLFFFPPNADDCPYSVYFLIRKGLSGKPTELSVLVLCSIHADEVIKFLVQSAGLCFIYHTQVTNILYQVQNSCRWLHLFFNVLFFISVQ